MMQLAMVGLGRMGANMALRLGAHGIEVVGYDADEGARARAEEAGIRVVGSLGELVEALTPPRAVWVMLPAAVTDEVLGTLAGLLAPDDLVIDGGNGYYRDDQRHAKELAAHGLHHLDVGTSGGVHGRERGYCLMVGGERALFERVRPIFEALAPGVEAAPRTRDQGEVRDAERGFLYCGDHGAGHFVKMVHNGIEYGMMAALAEGLAILEAADAGDRAISATAEVAPLRDPDAYRYHLPVADVAELWRRGSVVSSWLLDLCAHALGEDPALSAFRGRVSDSGEGRWTVLAAIDEGVPAAAIATALFSRFQSQGNADFADRVLSALRKEFGGHDELPKSS
jgi:6-phosphogluconate dehydrogenase